jgi:hypothetical protein
MKMKREFLLGGYFIVMPSDRASYMEESIVPNRILSVSNCICEILPAEWGLSWVKNRNNDINRIKNLLKLNDDEFLQLETWVTSKFDEGLFGWPNGFVELNAVKEFTMLFLSKVKEAYILSIGLTKNDAKTFLEEEKTEGNIGKSLIYSILEKGIKMDTSDILGFDVLGYETSAFHSYLCNGLEKDFYRELKITPNMFCFYDRYEEAEKATDLLINEVIGAEPALWQTWVINLIEKINKGKPI